ncbi:MAG: imidazole glycerol phosphate synthase subunit HisH [Granulosicoccus sp.]
MTVSSLTGIVNYGIGNVRSVQNAVEKVGGTPLLSADVEQLMQCDRLILPGVGAFAHGIAQLRAGELDKLLDDFVADGRPVLGICLGMQLLTQGSLEFDDTAGLGFTDGQATQLQAPKDASDFRLPHVNWKTLRRKPGVVDWFYEGVNPAARFYFIHSFGVQGDVPDIAAWAEHSGVEFAAVIARNNVIGTQFHPEKSGPQGLKMLGNFVSKGNKQ